MSPKQENWTVIQLINWSTDYLLEKQIDSARLCVEQLLCHTLNLTRVKLYLNFDKPLAPEELSSFKKKLLRCAAHEPVQYILGSTQFLDYQFKVNPHVLIPRPETELLVHKTTELARLKNRQMLLDVGTGSGVIAISLAKLLPDAQITAIDISNDALETARLNAVENGVEHRIEFREIDILNPAALTQFKHQFDIVVANPPYIAQSEKQNIMQSVRDFEPEIALFADDPLIFFKTLASYTPKLLHNEGILITEIGYDQAEKVEHIFSIHKLSEIEILKDLAGRDRIAKGVSIQEPDSDA